ncbi:hypothetical protein GPECTOR_50g562 [Gonium pectorale]|uniref:Malic enzyme n=1 Tax=Gonium pectorale TaxID=33097 RepID=A0A150G7C7_GONPE|nr:hypothetical protein GPECTOR_50g562 [Gonium pectorale]|eukprot:KXZ45769.1 hypothetical protein GPECTOR_50g562 [Gonium pectorale]
MASLLMSPAYVVRKTGIDLLKDPWCNKGSAFPRSERDRLGLRGLLPPRSLTLELQAARFMEDYHHPVHLIPPEDVKLGGVTSEMARRWKAIVVTDGSRILGLGDLGLNGLGIPIGKLDLYCAAAGFSPSKVLPVVIDVGTNNKALRNDPHYAGLRIPRITGPEYFAIVDEFVAAAMSRWPNAVLQFEDFSIHHAGPLLERYRAHHLVFNDDIQASPPDRACPYGTAATALAGLYGALRVLGLPPSALAEQRVVCVGAGSAGMGVVRMIAAGMQKQGGLTAAQAASRFWVLDYRGLITSHRPDVAPFVAPFARPAGDSDHEGGHEGEDLLSVVRRVKPTILLGLAGAGRLFTPEVLAAMDQGCPQQRPIIFPMSNPTSKMECTAEEALRVTRGRAIFASGSPQPPVELPGEAGGPVAVSQANNMYIFPGVALGAYMGQTRIITDRMLMAAADELPRLVEAEDLKKGHVYPRLESIRDIAVSIATAVASAAGDEGRLCGRMRDKYAQGPDAMRSFISRSMFYPEYSALVHLPRGIDE